MPPAGQRLAGEDLGQRGLPGAVAADEPDPVAGGDPEGHVVHQQARTSAHLELGDSDQDRLSKDVWRLHLMGRVRWGTSWARRWLVYEPTRVKGTRPRCASTRRPGSTRARSRPAAVVAGGGGMRLPIPSGGGGKIGLGTIVVVILFVVLNQCTVGSGDSGWRRRHRRPQNTCKTGADANKSDACAIDLFTNSVQDYWKHGLPPAGEGAVRDRQDGPLPGLDRLRAAARPPPTRARSTARTTARSTSTRRSSRTCSRASSAPRAAPSRSAT